MGTRNKAGAPPSQELQMRPVSKPHSPESYSQGKGGGGYKTNTQPHPTPAQTAPSDALCRPGNGGDTGRSGNWYHRRSLGGVGIYIYTTCSLVCPGGSGSKNLTQKGVPGWKCHRALGRSKCKHSLGAGPAPCAQGSHGHRSPQMSSQRQNHKTKVIEERLGQNQQ